MKKSTKVILYIILATLLAAALIFFIWSQQTYKPSKELHELVLEKDYKVENDAYIFEPEEKLDIGIILYPGAKVEPLAYGYIAERLAEQGYLVAIPNLRMNMSIFEPTAARPIMDDFPQVERWIIAGHSLGGVSAASFANKHPEGVAGLLLLASYPSKSVDFSNGTLPTLSIYAENDEVSPPKDILKNQSALSSTAVLHEIQGGNHAGFGMYGKQSDDGEATISNFQQQNQIIAQILNWLKTVKGENIE